MSRKNAFACMAIVCVTLIAEGCSGDSASPVAPVTAPPVDASAVLTTQVVNADIAVAAGAAVMSDLDDFAASDAYGGIAASVNVPVSASDNPAPPSDTTHKNIGDVSGEPAGSLPTVLPNICTVDLTKGETRCNLTMGKTTSSSTITFVDAAGHTTAGFKAGTTDTVRTTMTASWRVGSADSAYSGVFHRSSSRAVGGFLESQGNRTTNGAGTGADTVSFRVGAKTRSYAGVTIDSTIALVYAEHRAANPYPKSGSMVLLIHSVATAGDAGAAPASELVDRRVVATYDGTATAVLQIGTTVCQLHLDSRKVDGCH